MFPKALGGGLFHRRLEVVDVPVRGDQVEGALDGHHIVSRKHDLGSDRDDVITTHSNAEGVRVGQGVIVLIGFARHVTGLEGGLPVGVDFLAFLCALVGVGLGLELSKLVLSENGGVSHNAFTEGLGVFAGVGLIVGIFRGCL